MKRTDFLKLIGSGTGGIVLGSVAGHLDDVNYQLTDGVIYDNYLNGVQYREQDLKRIQPVLGDVAHLERDHDNPYDFYAVKVIVRDTFIGYLPAHENIVIANLMDAGAQLKAVISKLNLNNPSDHYLQKSYCGKGEYPPTASHSSNHNFKRLATK
ncbi:MAG: HIRAN domain-containing protein [Nonlabens sp.]